MHGFHLDRYSSMNFFPTLLGLREHMNLLKKSGADSSNGLILARDINLNGAKEFSYMTLDQIREKLRQAIFGSCSYYEVLSGRASTLLF